MKKNNPFSVLNDAQFRAVEAVDGPVMVVAGPGTGKTHILASRVAKILIETDTKPQNILCLTFTEAGVVAMRNRLMKMIGPDAYRVPISTFHGFCNRVIQENMSLFSQKDLEPVTELERIEIVRGILSTLPIDNPLRDGKKNAFQYEDQVRNLFSMMKSEDWSVDHVCAAADEYLQDIPNNPAFVYQRNCKYGQKGEIKVAAVEDATEKMRRLISAAQLFPAYQEAMTNEGRYEFEDMILWVLRAFEKNEALLRDYQERFLYVQVDEFQDTNGSQYALLKKLLDYWEQPNVFIVGDDDQSIYEFQGARLGNLRDFHERYKPEVVVLSQNYRSLQSILDASTSLIGNNAIRAVDAIGVEKELVAHRKGSASVKVNGYKTRLDEASAIGHEIKAVIAAGTPPKEIAVIYSKHAQADTLIEVLGRLDIPYYTKRPVNILTLPVIQQVRELLTYLSEEAKRAYSAEHRLFRLLHADFFQQDPNGMAKLSLLLRRSEEGERKYWRDHLDLPLGEWITMVQNLPLPTLLETLFAQTGLLNYALLTGTDIDALSTFMDFVKAEARRRPVFFAPKHGQKTGVARLLSLFDSMDENGIPMPLRQVDTGDGVQLLTAHGAKGLEFQQVFILDAVEAAWEKHRGNSRGRFAMPPTLIPTGEEDALESRRRLFYVAMTRAKDSLVISSAQTASDDKPLTSTGFIYEAGLEPSVAEAPSFKKELLAPAIYSPELEANLFNDLVANFKMSVTSLTRYLRCPVAFYYEDFLKIPSASSEAGTYGSVMHNVMQEFLARFKRDRKAPARNETISIFDGQMERMAGLFSEENFKQRQALGRAHLFQFWDWMRFWTPNAIAERRFTQVEVEGVPLTGVIDKIEWPGDSTITVTDYKTGYPNMTKIEPPSDKRPYGGDYWLQLGFYRLLIGAANVYPERIGAATIQWLEPNFQNVAVEHSGDDLRFISGLIRDTYAKILAGDFKNGCNDPDCGWCQMHKWKQPNRLNDELLDD